MSLHRDIMNLPFVEPKDVSAYRPEYAAKLGHRDARHAAAELAAPYDALVEQMAQALADMSSWVAAFAYGQGQNAYEQVMASPRMEAARAALAAHAEVTK